MEAPPEINVAEYVKDQWFLCPWCKEDNITNQGGLESSSNIAAETWECNSCNAIWEDIFKIHHISWEKNGEIFHSNELFQD